MKDFFNLLTKSIGILVIGVVVLIIGASSKITLNKFSIEIESKVFQILLIILGFILVLFYLFMHIKNRKKALLSTEDILKEFSSYEWQWAGQNWMGKVDFKVDADKKFKVFMDVKKLFLGGQDDSISLKYGPIVLKNVNGSSGTMKIEDNKLLISDLLVNRSVFDMDLLGKKIEIENIKPIETISTKIEGELNFYPSFAGKIKYTNTKDNSSHDGDIILVPYTSHINP